MTEFYAKSPDWSGDPNNVKIYKTYIKYIAEKFKPIFDYVDKIITNKDTENYKKNFHEWEKGNFISHYIDLFDHSDYEKYGYTSIGLNIKTDITIDAKTLQLLPKIILNIFLDTGIEECCSTFTINPKNQLIFDTSNIDTIDNSYIKRIDKTIKALKKYQKIYCNAINGIENLEI